MDLRPSRLTRRTVLRGAAGKGAAATLSPFTRRLGRLAPVHAASSAPTGRLVIGIWQNPDTLDPGASGLIASDYISTNVFDPLIWRLPGMRQFRDGTPFTARAVKDTVDHIVNPETRSRGARPGLGAYARTEVRSDDVAVVVFNEPNGAVLNNVCTAGLSPTGPSWICSPI